MASASEHQPVVPAATPTTMTNTNNTTTNNNGLTSSDLAAATALINHFIHGGKNDVGENTSSINGASDGSDGRTVFHNLVVAAAAPAASMTTMMTASTATPQWYQQRHEQQQVDEKRERKLDGLLLIEALCVRMKEVDRCLRTSSNNNNNNHSKKAETTSNLPSSPLQSHFHRLLLARDFEGYTPMHHAIYHRDLLTVLLLLGHAADPSASSTYNSFSHKILHLNNLGGAISGGGIRGLRSHSSSNTCHGLMTSMLLNQSHHHPLQLLNGNLRSSLTESGGGGGIPSSSVGGSSNSICSFGGSNSSCRGFRNDNPEEEEDEHYQNNMANATVNKLAALTDNENLTPLQLLGKTSEGGLERCRLVLYYQHRRMRTHSSSGSSSSCRHHSLGHQEEHHHQGQQRSRRRRRRMISFGDDRDYDALNFEIENDSMEDRNGDDIDDDDDDEAAHHGGIARQIRRGRGNSFHDVIDLLDDDEGDNRDDGRENDEDIMDSDDDDDDGDDSEQHPQRAQSSTTKKNTDEYGCEVLTFGRADHYALGVPQFTNSSSGRGSGGTGKGGSSSSSSSMMMMMGEASCKPRRVESFALSALRRNWSNSSSCDQSVTDTKHQTSWDGTVDSPAVAVAASNHHTLVSTQSGRLYAFGYGKSGRLGTGDECHRPLPTPIFGQLANRFVVSIAAAENHSLCSTSDGKIFAWGSNSYGQLGTRKDSDPTNITSRLSPRRVEGLLKQSFVVAVAAGDRHSVALTKSGEVYCWGDNRSGQLGMYNGGGGGGSSAMSSPTTAATYGVTSPTNNGRCSYVPQRVEGLWSTHPRRRAIAIAAAEFSTLVLTLPPYVRGGGGETSSLVSLPVNCVYGWGHGNHSIMRVVFPRESMAGNASVHARSSYINPTAIACAKYHNVAITIDGRVFTWGLHSETLGIESSAVGLRRTGSEWSVASEGRRPRSNSLTYPSALSPASSASAASSPQLVIGMLPENGGGRAVAVSASESHTAVVTSDGHLFTWGTSVRNNLLGHKGVKWQPSPRKVQRIHRAVGVAAAKEHTVLLIATTFPSLPAFGRDSLNSLGGSQPLTLQECAAIEISRNVDLFNVVPTALVARRLDCRSLIHFCDEFMRKNLDGVLAVGNKNDFASFLSVGRTALVGRVRIGNDRDGIFHPFLYDLAISKTWADGSHALLKDYSIAPQPRKVKRKSRREKRSTLLGNVRDGEALPVAGDKNCSSIDAVAEKVEVALTSNKASSPQMVNGIKDKQSKLFSHSAETNTNAADSNPKFLCDVCNVVCPDCDRYTLHINGRKHRNRLAHASAEEERNVAESMMAKKRMMMMMKMKNSGECVIDNTVAQDQALEDCKQPFDMKKTKKAWTNNTVSPLAQASERRERSKSFQEILNEQQEKSLALAMAIGARSTPTALKRPSGTPRTVQTALTPKMKSTPPISPPGKFFPLIAYMEKGMEQKRVDTVGCIGATWGARQACTNGKGWGVSPANKNTFGPQVTKSFSEIQQEEEALRFNEDHMCHIHGNHWYVQQRERAASIGEIQEQEKQNREMQLLIEEQRQIENDILLKTKQKKLRRRKLERNKGGPVGLQTG